MFLFYRFSFKSSYDYHMNRSSFNITYYCVHCKDTIVFTNKCKLHLHINSHPNTFLNISKMIVIPLSAEDILAKHSNLFKDSSNVFFTKKIDTTKIVNVDQSFNSKLEELSKNNDTIGGEKNVGMEKNVSMEKNVNAKEAISIEKNKNRSLNSDTQDIIYCPICYDFFKKNNDSLFNDLIFNHLQYLDDSKGFDHICKDCKRFLPNKCAMIAHQKIHEKKFPYICPECGDSLPSFPIFEKHLNVICFHNSRRMVVKCVKEGCKSMCFEQDVEKHFMSHMKSLFKCIKCCETFDTKEQLIMHSKFIHQQELENSESVLECQVCMRIIAKNDESSHALSHFNNTIKANYLYMCEGCKFYFSKIYIFKQHLNKCAPYIKKKKEFLTNNMEIKDSFKISEVVEKVSNIKTYTMEINDLPKISDTVENDNNVKKNNKEIKDLPENCDVVEKVINVTTNTTIPNTSKINFEFVEVSEKKIASDDENSSIVHVFKNKQPAAISPGKSQKRKRKLWGKKKIRILESKKFDEGIILTNVSKSDNFQCYKCKFISSIREKFHEHIMTHRDICSDYQCMECGACFSTKKSFSMHLLINHNIIEADSYIRLNNCHIGGVEKKDKPETSKETAADQIEVDLTKEELLCDICTAPFLNASDLEKHFRSHGMAFLMTKKRQ